MPKIRIAPHPPDKGWVTPTIPTTTVPDPQVTRQVSSRVEQRELTYSGPSGPRVYACGEQWLGGKIQYAFFDSLTNPNVVWYVVELCAGECDALLDVTDPGRPSAGLANLNYWWHAGTPAGVVDPLLAAIDPTWDEAFEGTCYGVVQLGNFSTYWNLQFPNLVWHMRARKVLKPDTGTRGYSTIGWDQLNDFAVWSEGKALPAPRIDTAAIAAAKAADVAAGRTFPMHMLVADFSDPDDVIQSFALMLATYWFFDRAAGKYTVSPDRAGAPLAATYGDHQRSKAREVTGGRNDASERPNKITLWYTDTTTAQRQVIPMSYPSDDSLITGPIVEEEHRVPWIYDANLVQWLLVYIYNSHQFDLRVSGRWNALTEGRRLGDVVDQYLPKRGRTVRGRIIDLVPRPDSTYDYTLLEHNELKFSAAGVSTPAKTPSTFPDPSAAPKNVDPATVTITEELFAEQSGQIKARSKAVFTIPDTPLDRIEIFVSVNGGDFRYDGRAPSGLTGAVVTYAFNSVMETGVQYTFKFVTISKFEIASSGSTKVKTFNGKTAPPADLLSLTGAANGSQVRLRAQPSGDLDVLFFEWRRGTSDDTWSTAALLGQTKVNEWFDTPPFGTAVRYFAKAVAAGQYSNNAATFDITLNAVGDQAAEVPLINGEFLPDASFTRVVPGVLAGATDPTVGLWYGSGSLIMEASRALQVAGTDNTGLVTQRLFLTRNFSPATAESERSAGGYSSVGAWATNVDDPRRGGAPLWAPLPTSAAGEIWGTDTGQLRRLAEHRVRLVSVTHAGLDTPANVSLADPLFLESATPTVRQYGQTYSTKAKTAGRGVGVRITTNSPFYQQVVSTLPLTFANLGGLIQGGLFKVATELKTYTIVKGTTTTDGTGQVTIAFTYPPTIGVIGGAWLSVRALPLSATLGLSIQMVAIDLAAQTIQFKSVNGGAAVASVPFSYEIVDNGGSTFASFGTA